MSSILALLTILRDTMLEVDPGVGDTGLAGVEGWKEPLSEIVGQAEQVIHVPVWGERPEPAVLHQQVARQQTAQHPYRHLEHLRT